MKITLDKLENNQIWIYAFAIIFGAVIGLLNTNIDSILNPLISPLIAILLFVMFAQIPFLKLGRSLLNVKFTVALLIGNFIVVPIIVWILISLFPLEPAILLGVCLVLLTPCIDYVIAFTKLGKGDEKLMLASTPILFLLQMILLPLYLWIFIGQEITGIVKMEPFIEAFLLLIVIPLLLAIVSQFFAKKSDAGKKLLNTTAWLPVFLMAVVLCVVVAAQIGKVFNDFGILITIIPIYVLYLIITPVVSKIIASLFKLNTEAGRTLIFSIGTRNSLVVLPLALALPGEWAGIAAAVIVTQTIVELIGEFFYIKLIPGFIK